jgi:hypothetical protein
MYFLIGTICLVIKINVVDVLKTKIPDLMLKTIYFFLRDRPNSNPNGSVAGYPICKHI